MVNSTILFLSNSQAELMQGFLEPIMPRCLVTFLISRLGSAFDIVFFAIGIFGQYDLGLSRDCYFNSNFEFGWRCCLCFIYLFF